MSRRNGRQRVLSITEAADRLGVDRLRLWRLADRGEIPTVVVEGTRHIAASDLRAIAGLFRPGGAFPVASREALAKELADD